MNLEKTVQKYRELFNSKPKVTTAHQEKGHFYVSPFTTETYHSVTYFTSFIKDPSLSNYKMNRALEHIRNRVVGIHSVPEDYVYQVLEEAKLAPEATFTNAGDIGTQTHAWREQFFSAWIESGRMRMSDAEIDAIPLPINADPEVISGCRAIKKFLKETGYIPVACELALVDDELKVGGTIDDLGVFPNRQKIEEINISDLDPRTGNIDISWQAGGYKIKYNPQLTFVDLKTSNQGKKPAYAFQVRGFYQRMIRKTFKVKPKKTYILHTSKDNGTYQLIDLTDMKFMEKDAQYLVHCSRSWDKVVSAFKPKIKVI
jgi:hypothetical protein